MFERFAVILAALFLIHVLVAAAVWVAGAILERMLA